MLCVNMIQAFDVERVIIGGGIMASAARILPHLQACVDEAVHIPGNQPSVVAASHPDHMALLGCDALFSST